MSNIPRLVLVRYFEGRPRLLLFNQGQGPPDLGEGVYETHVTESAEIKLLELPPLGQHDRFHGGIRGRMCSRCRLHDICCLCLWLRRRLWDYIYIPSSNG